LLLCEACFEREKEKTRRFVQVKPTIEEEPQPGTPVPEFSVTPEPEPEKTPEAPEPDFSPGEEFEPEPEAGAKPEVEPAETQYFDSFAEIPDLEGYQAKSEAPGSGQEKSEESVLEDMQSFKKIEEPAFDDTGFESPGPIKEIPKTKTVPAPSPAPEPKSSPEPAGSDEFVFSPGEVERLEEKSDFKPEPASEIPSPRPMPSEFSLPKVSESELDKEIFGELAEQKGKEAERKIGPGFKKFWLGRLPKVSAKSALTVGLVLIVILAGYFLITSQSIRSSLAKITSPPAGEKKPVKQLSEEDQKMLEGHLNSARELSRLDTRKSDLEALGEIRSALKIDKTSKSARGLNLLVASFLAYRDPGLISLSRAKALVRKADPELMAEPEAQAGRALVYLADENLSGARVVAEQLVKQHPDYAPGYWINAQIHLAGAVKKYDDAEVLLQKAIGLDPKLVQARIALAELHFQKTQYQPALEQFQEVLKLSPQHPEAGAKIKEIQNLLAGAKGPEEKPGGELLLVKPLPGSQPGATAAGTSLIPIPAEPGSAQAGATAPEPPEVDLNQELQNFFLQIISETRQPLSQSQVSAPAPVPVAPTPTTPSRPPEEVPSPPPPSRPPEEAP